MTIDPETTAALHKIWDKVHAPNSKNGLTFPETVAALADLGVSRYRVDFVSSTTSAYVGNQVDTYELKDHLSDLNPGTIAWAPEKLKEAVKEAQARAAKGEGEYNEFCRKAVLAGVVEYQTYIDGKKVVYFGPLGESHTEWFPGAGPKTGLIARVAALVYTPQ